MEGIATDTRKEIGIDLLRLLSMFMVLLLHMLGSGGILQNAPAFSIKYEISWFIEISCYCAVNCYAIITGYLLCNKRIKLSRLFYLWLEVLFYSVTITLFVAFFLKKPISKGLFFNAFTPVISGQYWYFTAYVGMYLFLPFFNRFLDILSQKQFKFFLLLSFVLFSILPTFRQSDIFKTSVGYSMWWLTVLYAVGAYIKRYVHLEQITRSKCALTYIAMIIFLWCNRRIMGKITTYFLSGGPKYQDVFIHYTSPFIVLSAIALFLLCVKSHIHKSFPKKIIERLAPYSFGVYLIHVHPLFLEYIWHDSFKNFLEFSPLAFCIIQILSAFLLYLAFIFVDYVRNILFDTLHIKRITQKLSKSMDHYISILFS